MPAVVRAYSTSLNPQRTIRVACNAINWLWVPPHKLRKLQRGNRRTLLKRASCYMKPSTLNKIMTEIGTPKAQRTTLRIAHTSRCIESEPAPHYERIADLRGSNDLLQ